MGREGGGYCYNSKRSGATGGRAEGQGAGGQSASPRLLTGKFLPTYREKRGKDKRENGVGTEAVASLTFPRKGKSGKMKNFSWKLNEEKLQNEPQRTFTYFLPHFGSSGGRVDHPGRPWLRHWVGKKENCEREVGKIFKKKWKWNEENLQNVQRPFFSFHFSKRLKFVLGSTKMGIFYREKAFHAGKKIRKMTLPPQKNMPVSE